MAWSVRPAIGTGSSAGSRPNTAANASPKACRPWPAVSTSVPSTSQSTSRVLAGRPLAPTARVTLCWTRSPFRQSY